MPYLVKAVSTFGIVTWLTRRGVGGRSIAARSSADVFATLEDASDAIAKMHWVFTGAGLRFSVVETYEEEGAMHVRDSVVPRAARQVV